MSRTEATPIIEYPETDGRPMGETDLHRDWMVRILELLRRRYRGQRVYVSSDLLVYYEEGSPERYVVPDVFVAKDCDPERRRTFKIWEEGKAPDVVFEVTSRRTRREDLMYKPATYSRMGVKEVFLYDPTSDYLKPPLQCFRWEGDSFSRFKPDASGQFQSMELGLLISRENGDLVFRDSETGELLLTDAEANQLAFEAAQRARQQAEEELRQLREQLRRRDD